MVEELDDKGFGGWILALVLILVLCGASAVGGTGAAFLAMGRNGLSCNLPGRLLGSGLPAKYPTGESEVLLHVPRYDFNWQHTYVLAQPKVLPAGTVIECTAHFDNSPNNKFNPDPKAEIKWGDQSWEEMMIGFGGYVTLDRQPAPRLAAN